MQRGSLKIEKCGRWKHCSKIIHRPGVCYCAVLSVVRKMSEAKVYGSVEQHIIIKILTKEGGKLPEIYSRLKRQYDEKALSNFRVYKWSSAFKKGRERGGKIMKSLFMQYLFQSPVTSSLLKPNTFLGTLISNTFRPRSSPCTVRDANP